MCDPKNIDHPGTDGVPGTGDLRGRRTQNQGQTRKKWAWRCSKLAQEDPSFRVETDEESGQTIISGMGELHLDIIVDRMKREFKVEANVGKPQVAYRETICGKSVEQEGKFVRQSGGRGQYGHVNGCASSRMEAGQRGTSSSTRSSAESCRRNTFPAVDKGVQEADAERRATPATRSSTCKVTLYDGSYHDVDSNEMAFKIAGLDGVSRKGSKSRQSGAAGTDYESRGRDARRLHG